MKQAGLFENRFAVRYLGREFRFQAQNALQQLYLRTEAGPLCGRLLEFGIGAEQALALASNCALLFQTMSGRDALSSPDQVLCRFPLGQIADLCALYGAHIQTIQGGAGGLNGLDENAGTGGCSEGWTEGGISERFQTEGA